MMVYAEQLGLSARVDLVAVAKIQQDTTVAAPTIWNSLPLAIRSSGSTYSFRRQLKTFFYNLAFRPS